MSFDFGTVSQDNTEVAESPVIWLPTVDRTFNLEVQGSGTLSNPTMSLWENGLDVSATKLTGSLSVSGRTIVSKTLQNLVGGSTYKWYIYFTDDSTPTVREGTIIVPKLGVNPIQFYPSAINKWRVMESPITMYPSQSGNYDLTIGGQGTLASATVVIYKNTSDESATLLTGSATIADRTITLPTITGLTGGFTYIVYVFFTDKGQESGRYFEIICPKLGV